MQGRNHLQLAIAANVRAELARRAMTQGQACKALGISRTAMGDRLRGTTSISAAELQQLADFLGVPITALYQPEAVVA